MKRTPLKPGKPPRKVSVKRAKQNRERTKVIKEILRYRSHCEAGPKIVAADRRHFCRVTPDDVHEPLTRARGGSITDPDNMVLVCRPCHDWIHNNPALAKEVGLLKSAVPGQ